MQEWRIAIKSTIQDEHLWACLLWSFTHRGFISLVAIQPLLQQLSQFNISLKFTSISGKKRTLSEPKIQKSIFIIPKSLLFITTSLQRNIYHTQQDTNYNYIKTLHRLLPFTVTNHIHSCRLFVKCHCHFTISRHYQSHQYSTNRLSIYELVFKNLLPSESLA